jgi:hypothetical protein
MVLINRHCVEGKNKSWKVKYHAGVRRFFFDLTVSPA